MAPLYRHGLGKRRRVHESAICLAVALEELLVLVGLDGLHRPAEVCGGDCHLNFGGARGLRVANRTRSGRPGRRDAL